MFTTKYLITTISGNYMSYMYVVKSVYFVTSSGNYINYIAVVLNVIFVEFKT